MKNFYYLINNSDLDFYSDETKNEEVINQLLNLHPDKLAINQLQFQFYKINYKYKTKRGNSKENEKYIFSKSEETARLEFINYITEYNKKFPHRILSNVKILDINYIGKINLPLK